MAKNCRRRKYQAARLLCQRVGTTRSTYAQISRQFRRINKLLSQSQGRRFDCHVCHQQAERLPYNSLKITGGRGNLEPFNKLRLQGRRIACQVRRRRAVPRAFRRKINFEFC
jgi:hypothetical protein